MDLFIYIIKYLKLLLLSLNKGLLFEASEENDLGFSKRNIRFLRVTWLPCPTNCPNNLTSETRTLGTFYA